MFDDVKEYIQCILYIQKQERDSTSMKKRSMKSIQNKERQSMEKKNKEPKSAKVKVQKLRSKKERKSGSAGSFHPGAQYIKKHTPSPGHSHY
jgi:hypothetical protein